MIISYTKDPISCKFEPYRRKIKKNFVLDESFPHFMIRYVSFDNLPMDVIGKIIRKLPRRSDYTVTISGKCPGILDNLPSVITSLNLRNLKKGYVENISHIKYLEIVACEFKPSLPPGLLRLIFEDHIIDFDKINLPELCEAIFFNMGRPPNSYESLIRFIRRHNKLEAVGSLQRFPDASPTKLLSWMTEQKLEFHPRLTSFKMFDMNAEQKLFDTKLRESKAKHIQMMIALLGPSWLGGTRGYYRKLPHDLVRILIGLLYTV